VKTRASQSRLLLIGLTRKEMKISPATAGVCTGRQVAICLSRTHVLYSTAIAHSHGTFGIHSGCSLGREVRCLHSRFVHARSNRFITGRFLFGKKGTSSALCNAYRRQNDVCGSRI